MQSNETAETVQSSEVDLGTLAGDRVVSADRKDADFESSIASSEYSEENVIETTLSSRPTLRRIVNWSGLSAPLMETFARISHLPIANLTWKEEMADAFCRFQTFLRMLEGDENTVEWFYICCSDAGIVDPIPYALVTPRDNYMYMIARAAFVNATVETCVYYFLRNNTVTAGTYKAFFRLLCPTGRRVSFRSVNLTAEKRGEMWLFEIRLCRNLNVLYYMLKNAKTNDLQAGSLDGVLKAIKKMKKKGILPRPSGFNASRSLNDNFQAFHRYINPTLENVNQGLDAYLIPQSVTDAAERVEFLCGSLDNTLGNVNAALGAASPTINKLPEVLDSFASTSATAKQTLQELFDFLKDIRPSAASAAQVADVAASVTAPLSVVTGMSSDAIARLFEFVKEHFQVIGPIAFMAGSLLIDHFVGRVAAVAFGTAVLGYYAYLYGPEIPSYLSSMFDTHNVDQGGDFDFLVEPLSLAYIAMGVNQSEKKDIVAILRSFKGIRDGIAVFIESLYGVSIRLLAKISPLVGIPYATSISINESYTAWAKRAAGLLADRETCVIDITDSGLTKFDETISDGYELAEALQKTNKALSILIGSQLKELEKMRSMITLTVRKHSTRRVPPTTLFMLGEPGVGKSEAALRLADALTRYSLDGDEHEMERYLNSPSQFVYIRTSEQYMDGFTNDTKVVIRDDHGSVKPSTSADSMWAEYIQEVNTMKVAVKMSEADKKGEVYWNNSWDIITTNNPRIGDDHIVDVGAVARRINFAVHVRNKDGRNAARDEAETWNPDIYEFELLSLASDTKNNVFQPTGTTVSFIELFSMMCARRRKVLQYYSNTTSANEKFVAKLLEVESLARDSPQFVKDYAMMTEEQKLENFEDYFSKMEARYGLSVNQMDAQSLIHDEDGDFVPVPRSGFKVSAFGVTADAGLESGKNDFESPRFGMGVGASLRLNGGLFEDFLGTRSTLELKALTGYPGPTHDYQRIFTYADSFDVGVTMVKIGSLFPYEFEIGGVKINLRDTIIPFPLFRHKLKVSMGERVEKRTLDPRYDEWRTYFSVTPVQMKWRVVQSVCRFFQIKYAGVPLEKFVSGNEWDLHLADQLAKNGLEAIEPNVQALRARILRIYGFLTNGVRFDLEESPYYRAWDYSLTSTFRQLQNLAAGLFNSLYQKAKSALQWLYEHKALVLGVAGVVSLILKFFSSTSNQDQASDEPHAMYSHRARAARNRELRRTLGVNVNQSISSRVHTEIAPKLRKNLWGIYSKDGKKRVGFALGVSERYFVIPRHYYTVEKTGAQNAGTEPYFYMNSPSGVTYKPTFNEIVIVHDYGEEQDVMLISIEMRGFPQVPDIMAHFATSQELGKLFTERNFLIGLVSDDATAIVTGIPQGAYVEDNTIITTGAPTARITVKGESGTSYRHNLITYRLPTIVGSCGCPVIVSDKIVAIQDAGNGIYGHGAIVTSDMLALAIPKEAKRRNVEEDVIFETLVLEDEQLYSMNNGYEMSVHNSRRIAMLPRGVSTFVKKTIVPYPSEHLPPSRRGVSDCQPANYAIARANVFKRDCKVDKNILRACVQAMYEDISRFPITHPFTPLNIKEAIVGVPGFLDSLNCHNSPGFPDTFNGVSREEYWEYAADGKPIFKARMSELVSTVHDQMRKLQHGIIPMYIWSDSLKEELRPFEKVGKPRIVSGASLENLLAARALFGPFIGFFSTLSKDTSFMLGFNPATDANDAEKYLRAFGGSDCHGDGDYSQYDKSIGLDLTDAVCDLFDLLAAGDPITNQEKAVYSEMRRSLMYSSVCGVHVRNRLIEEQYTWCSGNLTTALANSVINELLFRYSFTKALLSRADGPVMALDAARIFKEAIRLKVLGDDNRYAVAPGFRWFNGLVHAEIVAELGYTYTSADKVSSLVDFKPATSCTILKRAPVYHSDYEEWAWALDIEVIRDMVSFVIKGIEFENIQQRFDNALMELSLHPKAVWDEWYPRLVKHCRESTPRWPDYETARAFYMQKC